MSYRGLDQHSCPERHGYGIHIHANRSQGDNHGDQPSSRPTHVKRVHGIILVPGHKNLILMGLRSVQRWLLLLLCVLQFLPATVVLDRRGSRWLLHLFECCQSFRGLRSHRRGAVRVGRHYGFLPEERKKKIYKMLFFPLTKEVERKFTLSLFSAVDHSTRSPTLLLDAPTRSQPDERTHWTIKRSQISPRLLYMELTSTTSNPRAS